MNKHFVAGLTLVAMLLSFLTFPVLAAPEEETQAPEAAEKELTISAIDDFLAFAENCRLDSYSQNLTVYLEIDLHFAGTEFMPIPSFSGTFYGNGHVIDGISIREDGSTLGLFRYLTQSAQVCDLTVRGEITPDGTRSIVGGIAGSNAGILENCRFEGTVSGNEKVGGLVGINLVTGTIQGCHTAGTIHGDHFAGGTAGENAGVIRNCTNSASVNMTANESSVELSDITMDTITSTESPNTVTDIGGIAGTSTGVIRGCKNLGTVGYLHMGYNIGGIAGSQKGYITDCHNLGKIYGRKEVGGIVGQMEPIAKVEYTKDTLQILQQQLSGASAMAGQAAHHAQNSANAISGQISALQDQVQTSKDAIAQLIPNSDDPHLPTVDEMIAAKNTLTGAMSDMHSTMDDLSQSAANAAGSLASDITALTGQLSAMGQTIGDASENLGGTFTDVSDSDTPEDLTGKVENCTNWGSISGDINAGGIVGAAARESNLNPEADFQFSGDQSMNFNSELRAVILNCENKGTISAKKRQAGGIAGLMALGLVKDCVNTGTLDAESAQYVGGIAGNSMGFLRNCSAKCRLSGAGSVGGIAGCATMANSCRSMVRIEAGEEKLGAILGQTGTDFEAAESGENVYLPIDRDHGAIDGVSYQGVAQPLSPEDFLSLPALPEIFKTTTVTFYYEDGTTKKATLTLGAKLSPDSIPAIPQKEGYTGIWEGLEDADLSAVYFDLVFPCTYIPHSTTIESDARGENDRPVLLAEASFPYDQKLHIEKLEEFPTLREKETAQEGWVMKAFKEDVQLRYAHEPKDVRLMVRCSDGQWQDAPFTVNGSYLVFTLPSGADGFCAIHTAPSNSWLLWAACGAGAGLILLVVVLVRKSKKSPKKAPDEKDDEAQK